MVADGTVKLCPLAKYAPPGVKVPSFAGRQITLLDLATYTAGLPRELPDAPEPQPGQNPFTRFQSDAYWRWLSGATLPYAPGTGAMYSNLGFGLLGEALAKAGGKPYAALLKERVTDPLGMSDTTTKLAEAQKPRAMTGLDLDGTEAPLWETPAAMDASGNVFTTGDDMVRWMRWHLAPTARRAPKSASSITPPIAGMTASRQRSASTATTWTRSGWLDDLGAKQHRPLILAAAASPASDLCGTAPTRGVGVFVVATRLNFPMFQALTTGAQSLVAELAPR